MRSRRLWRPRRGIYGVAPLRCDCGDACSEDWCGFDLTDPVVNHTFNVTLSGYASTGACNGTTGWAVVNGTNLLTYGGTNAVVTGSLCTGSFYRKTITDSGTWRGRLTLFINQQSTPCTPGLHCVLQVEYLDIAGPDTVSHVWRVDDTTVCATSYGGACTSGNTTLGSLTSVVQVA